MRLPALFLSHGAPTLAVDETDATRAWARLAAELPKPRAILAVSAHWDTDRPAVSAAARPETIHDFHGFPRALYEVRYPAPGAPDLAQRVVSLLQSHGDPAPDSAFAATVDPQRGLDHGAWVPLKWMYPEADIPVTQLSVQSRRGAAHHHALGQALAPLRDEGVLIVASGGIVHNLREIQWQSRDAVDWARAFNAWIATRAAEGAVEDLLDYRARAPSAVRSHPTEEHLEPFFVALGAGGAPARRLDLGIEMGSLGMDGYVFG
jgi:4,5-DOPA dioxygenase extradiol